MNKVEVTRKFLNDFQLVFGGYLHPKFAWLMNRFNKNNSGSTGLPDSSPQLQEHLRSSLSGLHVCNGL